MGRWQWCHRNCEVAGRGEITASEYYLCGSRLHVLRSNTAPCDGVSDGSCTRWRECASYQYDMQSNFVPKLFSDQIFRRTRSQCKMCIWVSVVSIFISLTNFLMPLFAIHVTLEGCTCEIQGTPVLSNGVVRVRTCCQRYLYYLLNVQWWSSDKNTNNCTGLWKDYDFKKLQNICFVDFCVYGVFDIHACLISCHQTNSQHKFQWRCHSQTKREWHAL